MKKITITIALLALFCGLLPVGALAQELLVPVGEVVGLELREDRVTVAAFDDTLGARTKAAGLRAGDEIAAIDGARVHCSDDVLQALGRSDGTVTLDIRRGGKSQQLRLTPQVTAQGPRLGVYLREGITGIGTVTWYDPDTQTFGTLGHGVSSTGGQLLEMTAGSVCRASVAGVKKGKSGAPGQLKGSLAPEASLGTLTANTPRGVFGAAEAPFLGEAVPVAELSQVETGDAVIRSTVAGNQVREYSVKILKIYPEAGENGRNFLIRVTDPELLATTGGIVQGMSGSPILQNGRLIGAVTHVLVNSPDTGYGIFIENMLDAAS